VLTKPPPCGDGVDNDGDGFTDYPSDPGCRDQTSVAENPKCQDGLNNDNQTGIDFDGGASLNGGTPIDVADPECTLPWRNRESPGCGLGFELVLLAPLFACLAVRRRA